LWSTTLLTGTLAALPAVAAAVIGLLAVGATVGSSISAPLAAAMLVLGAALAGVRRLPAALFWSLIIAAELFATTEIGALAFDARPLSDTAPAGAMLYALLAAGAALSRGGDGLGRLLRSATFGGTLARWLLPLAVVMPTLVLASTYRWLAVLDPVSLIRLTEFNDLLTAASCTGVYWVAHRADLTLRAARDRIGRLARIAEATSQGVVVTDVRGVIEWVNAGFTLLSGYATADAVGTTPGALLQGPGTDPGEVRRIGAALRARHSVASELVNYTKDGRPYWVGMRIEPLFDADGEVDGFMAIETDVTERKERVKALDLLHSRFNLATHAARIGVYEQDMDTGALWWSDMTHAIVARPADEFKPTAEGWWTLIHPDDRARVRALYEDAAAARRPLNAEYRIVRPDGGIRQVQWIASFVTGDAGTRLVGVLLDVTEKAEAGRRERELQARLRQSTEQAGMAGTAAGVIRSVDDALGDLGAAAAQMRRNLTDLRIERVGQIAASLHDHRADLAFLTEDVRGKYLPDTLLAASAELAAKVGGMEGQLHGIDGFVARLRGIISVQHDLTAAGAHEPTDLEAVVEDALRVQAPDFVQFELVRDYQALPLVITDRQKLLQILVCYMSNACDALLLSTREPARITVRLHRSGADAVFSIEDTGPGMTAATLGKLWQFGFTTKRNGHGFGLHASANAARDIGATLAAASDGPGRGARFSVRLPIAAQRSASVTEFAAPPPAGAAHSIHP
jgi:PAS domain S-box-containing protein